MIKSSSVLELHEVMSSVVLSVSPGETLGLAAQLMAKAHASCLVVVEAQLPLGILTERDVVRLFHERVELDTPVAEVMSHPVITVSPGMDFHSGYALLQRNHVRHLVVVDENGLVNGIVSETDFRSHLEHGLLQRIRNLSSVIDRGFPSLGPDDSLSLAVERMAVDKWDYVLVVEAQRVLGIVTERDIPRLLAIHDDPDGVRLDSIMSTPVQTIPVGASVIEADALMTAQHLRHLAVIDEEAKVVGVISQHRLMDYLGLEIIDKPARQKAVQAEKKRLESRLQLVLDKTGIGIWEYDHRQDRCYWSESLCNLLGAVSAPFTLAEWLNGVHPEERDQVERQVRATLADASQLYEAEYRMRRADGRWLWFYARGKVVERDKEGAPLFTLGTMTDITQRKHAELLVRVQHDFSEKLAQSPTREVLQRAILHSALKLPELDGGGLYWAQPDGSYRLIEHHGLSDDFVARISHISADSPRLASIRGGRLQTSCCPACERCDDPTLVITPELAEEGIQALVVLPITVSDQVVACLNLASKHNTGVGYASVTALETLARQFSQALERLLAREQAQSREQDLSDLFAAIADFLFVLDAEGRILHYNNAVAVGLGYGDALLGRPFWQVHPTDSRDQARQMMTEMLAGQRASSPLPLVKVDGSRIYVDIRVVRGHWGGQDAIIGIARDVSEQRRQQEALLMEKHFSDDIINSLPGIFYMFDEEGRFLRWNHHFSQVSGYSDAVIATRSGPDFFDGEDRTRIAQAMKTAFDFGVASVEADFQTHDGQKIPYYFSGQRCVIDGNAYLIGLGIDISGERMMKQTLAHERSRLKTLVETIPDLVWLKDPDGVYLVCNPMFERFFGAKEKDIVGKTDYDFLPADEVEFFRAHDRAAMAAGKPTINKEWITFAADGHRALLETIKTPMRDAHGQVIGVLGIARDITAMHQAEEALREREEIYSSIVNQAMDSIVLIDAASLHFVEFNDAACRSLGYTREEFAGLTLYDIQCGMSREEVDERLAALLEVGAASFESQHRDKNGESMHVRISNRVIRLNEHTYLAAIWVDISEQIHFQNALNEANLFLRESQTIARVGGWKANPVANRIMWTEEVYRLVECPLDRPPATLDEALVYYAPDFLPKIKANLLTAWEQGTPFTVESEMISASGRHFWAELRCVGKIEQEGQVFLTGTFQDITERRQIEEDIRRLNQSLEQRVSEEVLKNREKDLLLIQQSRLATMGEMMHNVAHQWRQPLNTLNLILQNIRDAYLYGELDQAYLDEMTETGNRVSQRMSRTIDDFRNFFRPDAATSRFNLRESVAEALSLVEASFLNNQITVAVEGDAEIYGVGYANEFAQVLLNLLVNAKDAIKAHDEAGHVVVTIGADGGLAKVRVSDNGGGIPADVLPRIFDPYFTTKESGTGIGLYMSRMIMKHMHGDIEACNREAGAEITISLPLWVAA